jgi:MFS family permease
LSQRSETITRAQKMRGLPWLVSSEGLNSAALMLAMTTPFVLFLHDLGFKKTHIGLATSLVHLTAPLALVIAPSVERFGLKRTYLAFMGSRNFVLCGLILLPWVIEGRGPDFALNYAFGVMGLYGLLRIIAETALYPWMMESIPNSVRGKFTAVSMMASTATRLLAVLASGYVIAHYDGLWRYQILIAVGCCLGLSSVLVRMKVAGGKPAQERRSRIFKLSEIKDALADRNLLRYVAGISLLVLGTHSWGTFAPLFLKEVVGLSAAEVVLLQSGTMFGSFVFCYLWGYAADRYGSRPVLVAGIILIIGVPIGWLLMPVHSAWSLYWAATIAVMAGVGEVAWHIGDTKLLYESVVPPAKKMQYMAIFYAVVELTRFIGPVAVGMLLDSLESRSGEEIPLFTPGPGGPYQMYFTLAVVMLVMSLSLLVGIRAKSAGSDTDEQEGAA